MAAVPYIGKGLTLDLSKNSDLFWYPFANLRADQLLVYVFRNADRLDEAAHRELRRDPIRATVMGGAGNHDLSVPVWPRTSHLRDSLLCCARIGDTCWPRCGPASGFVNATDG